MDTEKQDPDKTKQKIWSPKPLTQVRTTKQLYNLPCCLPKPHPVGLQPTSWSGLHRCV